MLDEFCGQAVAIDFLTDRQVQRMRQDEVGWRQPPEQRLGVHDELDVVADGQPVEHAETIGQQVLRWGNRLVRQRLVIGKRSDLCVAGKERKLTQELLCPGGSLRDDDDRALCPAERFGERQRCGRAMQAAPGNDRLRGRRCRQR